MVSKIKERIEYFAELDKRTGSKHHVLYIEPDYGALLWEEDTVIYGGESDGFQFLDTPVDQKEDDVVFKNVKSYPDEEEDDDDDYEINIAQEASNWISRYVYECLIPSETEGLTREELARGFFWENFHEKGIEIAKMIAEQLPDNCELWYTIPWEDISKTVPGEILIKEAK